MSASLLAALLLVVVIQADETPDLPLPPLSLPMPFGRWMARPAGLERDLQTMTRDGDRFPPQDIQGRAGSWANHMEKILGNQNNEQLRGRKILGGGQKTAPEKCEFSNVTVPEGATPFNVGCSGDGKVAAGNTCSFEKAGSICESITCKSIAGENEASSVGTWSQPNPQCVPSTYEALPPMIFVTGLAGSTIYASLDHTPEKNLYCRTSHSDSKLWLDIKMMLPEFINCWYNNMALKWEGGQPVYKGVKSRLEEYGNSQCAGCTGGSNAFATIQSALKSTFGYPEAKFSTVVYDWRFGPKQFDANATSADWHDSQDFLKLTALVEKKKADGGAKVIFASLSDGSTFLKMFLERMSQSWKDEHIEGWISMGGPFAGAAEVSYNNLNGDGSYSASLPWLNEEKFRVMTAAMPGVAKLAAIPSLNATHDAFPFIRTPSRNYTYGDWGEALAAAGHTTTLQVWNDTLPVMQQPGVSPGVKTWCMHGEHVRTINGRSYDNDAMSNPSTVWGHNATEGLLYGDGDGTVHIASLSVCRLWSDTTVHTYEGVCHTCMLTDRQSILDMVGFVNSTIGGHHPQLPWVML